MFVEKLWGKIYVYVAVYSTGKHYSGCTLPFYPLSIYARDNPPSAQPRLGVSIEDRPLRVSLLLHIDPRIVLGYSCTLYYSCRDICGYNSTRCTRLYLYSYYGERVLKGDPILSWAVPTYPRVQKPIDRARGRGYAL